MKRKLVLYAEATQLVDVMGLCLDIVSWMLVGVILGSASYQS